MTCLGCTQPVPAGALGALDAEHAALGKAVLVGATAAGVLSAILGAAAAPRSARFVDTLLAFGGGFVMGMVPALVAASMLQSESQAKAPS